MILLTYFEGQVSWKAVDANRSVPHAYRGALRTEHLSGFIGKIVLDNVGKKARQSTQYQA